MRRLTERSLAFFQFFLVLAGRRLGFPGDGRNAPLSPYFAVDSKRRRPGAPSPRRRRCSPTFNGVMADVYVTQTYANDGVVPITRRRLPRSTRAAIHGLRVRSATRSSRRRFATAS